MIQRVWPKVEKERRKELARAVRARIAERAMGIGDLATALEIEPEEVVVVMRELRGKKRGRLVSGLALGQTVWRWEERPKSAKRPGGKSKEKKPKSSASTHA